MHLQSVHNCQDESRDDKRHMQTHHEYDLCDVGFVRVQHVDKNSQKHDPRDGYDGPYQLDLESTVIKKPKPTWRVYAHLLIKAFHPGDKILIPDEKNHQHQIHHQDDVHDHQNLSNGARFIGIPPFDQKLPKLLDCFVSQDRENKDQHTVSRRQQPPCSENYLVFP